MTPLVPLTHDLIWNCSDIKIWASGCLPLRLKTIKGIQIASIKSGHSHLKEVMTNSVLMGRNLAFWKTDCLGEVVVQGGKLY